MLGKFVPRKKTLEAVKWDGSAKTAEFLEAWSYAAIHCKVDPNPVFSALTIDNPNGPYRACVGDYIVRTSCGQYIPIPQQQFLSEYEAAR